MKDEPASIGSVGVLSDALLNGTAGAHSPNSGKAVSLFSTAAAVPDLL